MERKSRWWFFFRCCPDAGVGRDLIWSNLGYSRGGGLAEWSNMGGRGGPAEWRRGEGPAEWSNMNPWLIPEVRSNGVTVC